MSVRYAKLEDIKYAAMIKVDGWKTAYRGIIDDEYLDALNYEETITKWEARFERGFWCVYENEEKEILGFSCFGERQYLDLEGYNEYDSELVSIYVRPDCKGKGVGKELFNFVTAELKNKGKNKMILWVLEDNIPSREFYKKMGGILVGKKEQEIGNKIYSEVSFGYNLLEKTYPSETNTQKQRI